MARMDDEKLLAHLNANEADAAQYMTHISGARLSMMQEYNRDPYPGDEELDGWSTIVTSEVQDTVEWVLPDLLDIFTTTDEAVVFEPTAEEDVAGAQQATDCCNYIFYKRNNGFLTLYTAFKDALMTRNCAVMWRKQEDQTIETQELEGATPEVLALMVQQGWEIKEATQEEEAPGMVDEFGQPVQQITFDATLIKKTERHTIKIEAFPPEQLYIRRDWNSPLLDECPYVCRLMLVTLSDLKEMGFKGIGASDLRSSSDGAATTMEERYKLQRADGTAFSNQDQVNVDDESQAEGWLRIESVLVDYDDDGIAERRTIFRLENKILRNDVAEHVPFATSSPIINTHRWDGMSLSEMVSDLQRLRTDLTRNTVNAANLAVNPRKTVLTDLQGAPYANMDDLLDFRIGGIVRQTRPDSLGIEPSPFNGAHMLPLLSYVEDMLEKRTGVSKQQQGLDPNSLRPDRTAAEVMMTASAARQRVKLIARIFAETLVKPIFLGIFKLLTDGEMEPLAFRLRGQFVKYDPKEWRDQYDMTINVGLGAGDKAQQLAHFQQVMQMQMGLAQTPFGQMMIQPQNIYNTAAKTIELIGQKNVNDFVMNPNGKPLPPPPPPPQLALEQAKLQQQGQIEQAKMQMQGQAKQMEMQFKAQAADMDRRQQAELEMIRQQAQQQTDANRQAMEAQMNQMKLEHEARLNALKAQYEDQRHMRDMEFQRWKAELDASVKIESANISSKAKLDNEATKTATAEIGREVQP